MKSKDLAKLLGVSPATISLVLNNKPGISDSLRVSLVKRIKELGCEDMLAGEHKNETKNSAGDERSIAYLSYMDCESTTSGFFFPGALEGSEVEARENGFNFSVIHRTCYPNITLNELLRRRKNVVAAIVQADDTTPEIINEIKDLDIPVVFIDSFNHTENLNVVRTDNFSALATMVSYLMEKGHTNIGYMYTSLSAGWHMNRLAAFRCALNDLGLQNHNENYFCLDNDEGSDDPYEYTKAVSLLKSRDTLPTAFVCESDRQAMRTVNALKAMGLRVPEDISVIGFDDSLLAKMTSPKLTTMRNSSQLMGRACVMMLQNLLRLKEIGTETNGLKLSLPVKLIERDSVRELNPDEPDYVRVKK